MDPARYLDLFVTESRDHLAASADLAGRVAGEPADGPALRELFRHLHSLKGMAATMGFSEMRDLAHATEGLLEALREGRVGRDERRCALIAEAAASLERMVERAERQTTARDDAADRLIRGLREATRVERDPEALLEPLPEAPAEAGVGPRTWRVALILDRDRPFPALRAAVLLSRLGRLGRVASSDPPMALLRSGRCDGRLAAVVETELDARRLAARIARLEDVETFSLVPLLPAAPPPPRGPGRWVRVNAELLDRLMEDTEELARALRDPAGGGRSRSLARRMRRGLAEARLVPFESAAQRLDRGARELARSLGKGVELTVEGRDVRVDRALLDHLIDPLLHLIRNAIDHGLEGPDERRSAGKSARGSLRLRVARHAGTIRIEVEDDGRGLDPAVLRRVAAERGFIAVSEAARLSDREAFLLATLPGFSTAVEPNSISGRGVGLDVVRASVEDMGGRLLIEGSPGRGTRVTLALPLTLALVQALIVRCGGEVFAIPAGCIRRAGDARAALRTGARELAALLGVPSRGESPGRAALELAWEGSTTIVVEEVVGRKEIVLRPVAPLLLEAGIYSGAALLDDGTIVPVLDPEALS